MVARCCDNLLGQLLGSDLVHRIHEVGEQRAGRGLLRYGTFAAYAHHCHTVQGSLKSIGVDTGKGSYYRSGCAAHGRDECHQRRAIANRLHARAIGDIVGSTTDDYDGACRACQLLGRLHGIVGALAAVYALALDVGIHECHNL